MDILITLGVIVAIILIGFVLVPYLKKKGYIKQDQLDMTQMALELVDIINQSLNSKNKVLIDLIVEACQLAVHYVEQVSTTADNATKKQLAINTAKEALVIADIEITPEIEKIIDITVESVVHTLPATYEK